MTEHALPWATTRIDAWAGGNPLPVYGSPEWHALPEDSPVRVASLIQAAECWRTSTTPEAIEERLRYELAGLADAEAGVDPDSVERFAQIEAMNRRTIDDVTRRMLADPQPTETRAMVQTDDWPTIRLHDDGNVTQVLEQTEATTAAAPTIPALPSTTEMLRRLAATS